jgi:uncharacterized membrane protein
MALLLPGILVVTSAILAMMSLGKYLALHTSLFDYGLFLNHLFNISSLDQPWRIIFGHVKPILFIYSYIYLLLPDTLAPLFLLALQVLCLVLPVIWLRKYYGYLVAITYLLIFPLWYNGLFDFHVDHLVVPVLCGFFLLIEKGRIGWAAVLAMALVLVKEPFALQTAGCGIYLIYRGVWPPRESEWPENMVRIWRARSLWAGLSVIIFGFAYFLSVTHWVLPIFWADDVTDYFHAEHYFSRLNDTLSLSGRGPIQIAWYMVTHPFDILKEVVNSPKKIIYVLALFGAMGFIPLLHPGPLLVAMPIFAISLLSPIDNYYGLGHQYTAGLMVPMIFSFIGGLPRGKKLWKRIGFPPKLMAPVLIIGLVAVHVALAPSPIGRLFWSPKVWSYHYKAYFPTERDAMIKNAIKEHVPADVETSVSVQNTLNWAPLVERRYILVFPQGIAEASNQPVSRSGKIFQLPRIERHPVMADYVILDMKRPWFLLDKGCEWYYGECRDAKMAARYLEWVTKARRTMLMVFEEDGFVILRRSQ